MQDIDLYLAFVGLLSPLMASALMLGIGDPTMQRLPHA